VHATTRDAVVIGGGIVGCAIANFLAQAGLQVTVLERLEVAGCQSGLNAGWIRALGRAAPELPLIQASTRIWRTWTDELGLPLTVGGGYSLARDDAQLALLQRWKASADGLLPGVELLAPEAVATRLPWLRGSWRGAIHHAADGYAEPREVTLAVAARARALGVEVRERATVARILTARGAVHGVSSSGGDVRAPLVVCAAGAWTSRLLRPVPFALPVLVLRSTLMRTQSLPPIGSACVMTPHGALRQSSDGSLVVAAGVRADLDLTLEAVRFLPWFFGSREQARGRLAVHPTFLIRELSAALGRRRGAVHAGPWPAVAAPNREKASTTAAAMSGLLAAPLRPVQLWAGYVDVTPDALPMIGPVPEVSGLHVASGFSGHGFGVGPGAGKLAAQLILGQAPIVDPRPFSPERFRRRATLTRRTEALI
jgi:glycine/D-amino acid oxidase-like deaminating enzyme